MSHRPLDPRICNIGHDANTLDRNGSARDRLASGLRLTFESSEGFLADSRCANLRHATRHFHFRHVRRLGSAPRSGQGPQRASEARLARADRVAQRRGRRHERDHARDRQIQDLRLALAGAVRRRRREWDLA